MSYKLYQVAILELPKKGKEGETPAQIVLEPVSLIARTDQDAAIKAAMKFADKLKEFDQERLEVVVRPF